MSVDQPNGPAQAKQVKERVLDGVEDVAARGATVCHQGAAWIQTGVRLMKDTAATLEAVGHLAKTLRSGETPESRARSRVTDLDRRKADSVLARFGIR